jgi:hemerythrin
LSKDKGKAMTVIDAWIRKHINKDDERYAEIVKLTKDAYSLGVINGIAEAIDMVKRK